MTPVPLVRSVVYRDCGIASGGLILVIAFLLIRRADPELIGYFLLTGPYAISLYWLCYARIIPPIIKKQLDFKIYLLRVIGVIGLTVIPLVAITSKIATGMYLTAANFSLIFQFVVTTPLAWEVYHYRLRSAGEITRLKTALGKSDSNYQFLQSQINPHFLFNTLNILLGAAMQENAERTGEGIQRLGDMMRFMLHENIREFIPLSRELAYVRNYIALQRLRIKNTPHIDIRVSVSDPEKELEIMPMLIIPFVENAFKHGISLRIPSYIHIRVETRANVLLVSVGNSVHARDINDPEKEHSGIGLKNLRQRLKLVYPDRYDLDIRQTDEEFHVRLELELTEMT